MLKLDIGSGDKPLPPEEGWLHLDVNPNAPHVEYIAPVTKIPLQDNSVDHAYMGHTIEHIGSLPEVIRALKEVYRILKPTGKLEIITPDLEAILERGKTDINETLGRLYGPAWREPSAYHQQHHICFTKDLLEKTLLEAGFGTVSVHREPIGDLYAIAFKKSPRKPDKLKLALSFLHEEPIPGPWAFQAEAFLKAASSLSIDAVSFTYDDPPPDDIEERIEIFRCVTWEARRKSCAYAFIPWVETLSPTLAWPEIQAAEQRLKTVDLIFADAPSNAIPLTHYTDKPVITFPLGYDPDLFYYVERDFKAKPFTFAHIGCPDDRLGTWEVGQAFQAAFPKEQDVQLLFITGGKRGTWEGIANQYQNDPRIIVDTTHYPHEKMIDVYAKVHCLVRPALGDSVAFTVLEAMATGMPVIAPRHLFYRELLSPSAIFYVSVTPSTINPTERGWRPYDGAWYVPDLGSLTRMMRLAYDDRDLTKQKGDHAAHFAAKNLTMTQSLKRILPLLNALITEGKGIIEELKLNPHMIYSFMPPLGGDQNG